MIREHLFPSGEFIETALVQERQSELFRADPVGLAFPAGEDSDDQPGAHGQTDSLAVPHVEELDLAGTASAVADAAVREDAVHVEHDGFDVRDIAR